ncbi:MAG TPA: MBL fold metallo-hydrolase [Acidimicrobiales bacterium]|nr:MBL fold metallo-hydrolase [Acidimicrobiales bacterium]
MDFGYFLRPAGETLARRPRVEPCLGYLVMHPAGTVLVDTGMGSHPDVDAHYRPARRPLGAALADAGCRLDDIAFVANCHLHFDHCGGNPELGGRPVFAQSVELESARRPEYTLPELVDAPGVVYEELDGEAEILPGVTIVPTPGHTPGHQSVLVRDPDGTITVVAGQSHDTASEYGADALAWRAATEVHAGPLPPTPAWIERLQRLDPRLVVFAHDQAVWRPIS